MRSAVFGLLLGSLCLVACDDDTDNGVVVHLPNPTAFALRSLNGRALPAIAFDSVNAQFSLAVVSGSFTINALGTFTRTTRFRETRGFFFSDRVVACAGTFTSVGNTLTFFDASASPECDLIFTGVASFDVVNTTIRGVPAIYTR